MTPISRKFSSFQNFNNFIFRHKQFILKLIGNTQTCFDELELYLEEMIQARRLEAQSGVEHHDLFSRLLYASDSETNPEKKLSTDELMGNIL